MKHRSWECCLLSLSLSLFLWTRAHSKRVSISEHILERPYSAENTVYEAPLLRMLCLLSLSLALSLALSRALSLGFKGHMDQHTLPYVSAFIGNDSAYVPNHTRSTLTHTWYVYGIRLYTHHVWVDTHHVWRIWDLIRPSHIYHTVCITVCIYPYMVCIWYTSIPYTSIPYTSIPYINCVRAISILY